MESKTCPKCLVTYSPPSSGFHKRGERNTWRSHCKLCNSRLPARRLLQKKHHKTYYEKHRKRIISSRKSRNRSPEQRRRERRRAYQRNKFRHNIRSYVRRTLNGTKRGRRLEEILGYTVDELRAHLERQFAGRMSWDNYGTYWHIDHIIPVSSFTFEGPDDDDFKACWALSNLRPLPAKKNMEKGGTRTHLL